MPTALPTSPAATAIFFISALHTVVKRRSGVSILVVPSERRLT
jgi:hypothetical protein